MKEAIAKLKLEMKIDDAVETLHATSLAKRACLGQNAQGQPWVAVRQANKKLGNMKM